jgi:DNA-binding Lrp family transcriptional regulator
MRRIAAEGSWLTPRDKLALVMIGDLVKDGQDSYWESQGHLAKRMGVSRRTAGDSVRRLTKHGALRFQRYLRTDSGSTVRVFQYQPERVTAEVSETFPPEVSEIFPPGPVSGNGQVGKNTPAGGKEHAERWEANPTQVSGTFPQTEEPETENRRNRDKLAPSPRHEPKNRIAIISETIADNILDDPQLLEAERHRQKVALGARVTS